MASFKSRRKQERKALYTPGKTVETGAGRATGGPRPRQQAFVGPSRKLAGGGGIRARSGGGGGRGG